jgi:hypothetical protein
MSKTEKTELWITLRALEIICSRVKAELDSQMTDLEDQGIGQQSDSDDDSTAVAARVRANTLLESLIRK